MTTNTAKTEQLKLDIKKQLQPYGRQTEFGRHTNTCEIFLQNVTSNLYQLSL